MQDGRAKVRAAQAGRPALGVCYLCGREKLHCHKAPEGYSAVRCAACQVIYVTGGVSAAELARCYGGDYFSSESIIGYPDYLGEEDAHRRNARRLLRLAVRHLAAGPVQVCDVGCAHGFLLDEARELGWETYGVEVSAAACRYARESLRLEHIQDGPLNSSSFPKVFFDVVFMIGTIEHLTDPRSTLRIIREILKPGGRLVLTTVDTRALVPLFAIKPPEHLFYFSHHNLRLLLRQEGFEAVSTRPHFSSYRLSDLLKRLHTFFGWSVFRLFKAGVDRAIGALTIRIPTNEMIVTARAPLASQDGP